MPLSRFQMRAAAHAHDLAADIVPREKDQIRLQRIRLRDGCQVENGEPAVRAWPVKIENGKVWVGSDALVMRAEAS